MQQKWFRPLVFVFVILVGTISFYQKKDRPAEQLKPQVKYYAIDLNGVAMSVGIPYEWTVFELAEMKDQYFSESTSSFMQEKSIRLLAVDPRTNAELQIKVQSRIYMATRIPDACILSSSVTEEEANRLRELGSYEYTIEDPGQNWVAYSTTFRQTSITLQLICEKNERITDAQRAALNEIVDSVLIGAVISNPMVQPQLARLIESIAVVLIGLTLIYFLYRPNREPITLTKEQYTKLHRVKWLPTILSIHLVTCLFALFTYLVEENFHKTIFIFFIALLVVIVLQLIFIKRRAFPGLYIFVISATLAWEIYAEYYTVAAFCMLFAITLIFNLFVSPQIAVLYGTQPFIIQETFAHGGILPHVAFAENEDTLT